MRPTLCLATLSALLVGLLGPSPAGASPATGQPSGPSVAKPGAPVSTTLGQVGAGVICAPAGPAAVVIDTQAVGKPTYVAPSKGVLTSFSHQANGQPGKVQAIVFADGAVATQKTVVAKSAKVTVTPNAVNTFPVRLPIAAGQRIGLGYSAAGMSCALPGSAGDATLVKSPFDPDTTTAFEADGVLTVGGTPVRPNLSAVLEPDSDGDGYGDVSQDACPKSGLTTAVCPEPNTKITKRPRHKSTRTKVKVKFKFTATVPGSTFQCKLDGHKKWKKCKSPYKRRLGVGKHQLRVRAVSPLGIPDSKPANVRFTIRRR